ncbi:MAG TPA: VOC family protein [Thermoleophilaceae bacterium]|nr:VOC family protein [Thermoleophilaceae bacterium]
MSETGSSTFINAVGRVAVPVTDQDTAIEFYVAKLGFSVTADVAYADGSYRWVEVAPPGGGTTLAIVPPRPGGPVGIDTNVILTTGDIEEAHAALRAEGVDVDQEVSHMGDPVPPMVWFRDQDGNTLLLVEERPDR